MHDALTELSLTTEALSQLFRPTSKSGELTLQSPRMLEGPLFLTSQRAFEHLESAVNECLKAHIGPQLIDSPWNDREFQWHKPTAPHAS